MGTKIITDHEFYCCICGERGIPIPRRKGAEREPGHLKKLFCLNCGTERNFCEINPQARKYTYDDFLLEFNYGNFDKDGNRKMSFNKFKQKLVKEGKEITFQHDI